MITSLGLRHQNISRELEWAESVVGDLEGGDAFLSANQVDWRRRDALQKGPRYLPYDALCSSDFRRSLRDLLTRSCLPILPMIFIEVPKPMIESMDGREANVVRRAPYMERGAEYFSLSHRLFVGGDPKKDLPQDLVPRGKIVITDQSWNESFMCITNLPRGSKLMLEVFRGVLMLDPDPQGGSLHELFSNAPIFTKPPAQAPMAPLSVDSPTPADPSKI